MSKLVPFYRELPILLIGYGLLMTVLGMVELQMTTGALEMGLYADSQTKVIGYIAIARSFDSLFFYAGFAALVSAINRLVDRQQTAESAK